MKINTGSLRNKNLSQQKKCVKVIYVLSEVTALTVKWNGRRFTTVIHMHEHPILLRLHKYSYRQRTCVL